VLNKIRSNSVALGAMLVTVGVLLGACGGDDASPATAPSADTTVPGSEPSESAEPWKLGALIPITGIETQVGESMKVATEIAVDEINAAGGILGRPIKLIIEDEASDPAIAVDKARKLIDQDKVDFIVGTLISAVRNPVVEVTSAAGVPLFNPTYYEGGLCQDYFFSVGALPNQQIEPFVPWLVENVGKSFYLIGSDYEWPRGSFEFVKAYVEANGGTIVGEEYVPFGVTDFSASISRILDAKPDVLYPLVAGSDGITFWKQLAGFDFQGARVSHSVSEAIAAGLDAEIAAGIYSAAPYFMVLENEPNQRFIEEYHRRLNPDAVMDTFGEGMYSAIHLIAAGAVRAGSLETEKLMEGIRGASFAAPQGNLTVDPVTGHAALGFHIAQLNGNKWQDFEILLSEEAIQPAADCSVAP
jgi:urea transport system substrate-binding protein